MPTCEKVGLDFIDRAHTVARVEIVVNASPAQVWQVLNETERWPEWFEGMSSAKVTSASWDGVGSSRSVKVGPVRVEEEMVVWEPEQHWGFCATEMSLIGAFAKRLLEVVEIAPSGTGSKLTYIGALDPVPWMKPLAGVLKKQVTSGWTAGLTNIDNQI